MLYLIEIDIIRSDDVSTTYRVSPDLIERIHIADNKLWRVWFNDFNAILDPNLPQNKSFVNYVNARTFNGAA